MEIIRKKISLENFRSRIPALIECIERYDHEIEQKKGAWGNIPKNITHFIFNKSLTFKEFMSLYVSLMGIVMYSKYFEYDNVGNKWITLNLDWRNIFGDIENRYVFVDTLPTRGDKNTIYGYNSNGYESIISLNINKIINDNYNIIDAINVMNNIIGREIVPPIYTCKECGNVEMGYNKKQCSTCYSNNIDMTQETYVPNFIYWVDVNNMIDKLKKLKENKKECCYNDSFIKHGGDVFLNYLYSVKENSKNRWNDTLKKWEIYDTSGDTPTLNINVLLTSKLNNFGLYKTFDVDVITDDDDINNEINEDNKSNVITISGESKIRTLRRRKCSVDDYGNELPGILSKNNLNEYILELPYKVGYIKNIKNIGDEIYGDTIVSINQITTASEITNNQFESFFSVENNKKYCINGNTKNTVPNLISVVSMVNELGDIYTNLDKSISNANSDTLLKIDELKDELIKYIKNDGNVIMIRQEYDYTYNIIYKNTNNEEDTYTHQNNGSVCVGINETEIEFTYVIGGKLKKEINGNVVVDSSIESNPFTSSTKSWNGYGMWYKEKFPLKKWCTDTFLINNKEITVSYDEIDFKSKEQTFTFDGIDFPRKNYILCESIKYRTNAYEKYATNDAVFKDEKMTNINFPIKEKYNIVIDRGTTAAFEKHIQLSDIKTWDDLENYRNGEYLK